MLLPQAVAATRRTASPGARIVEPSYTVYAAKSPVKPGPARYNAGVRWLALAVVITACSHPTAPANPAPGKPAVVADAGAAKQPAPPPKQPPPPGFVPAPDIGCPTTSCVYHAGVGQYFTCMAGGAGVCFHFGAACTPSDKCMYDAADRTYKTCKTPGEGTCAAYGAACAPTSKCMLEPATGLHKTCDHPVDGKCASYGALCSP